MNPEIDIYADNPVITLAYQIAVMQAMNTFTPPRLEGRYKPSGKWGSIVGNSSWAWDLYAYRIDPTCKPQPAPKIAEGHNPSKLTEEQVGVKDGWRLLSEDERKQRDKLPPLATKKIQVWLSPGWDGDSPYSGNEINWTYRTKQPPGFFLPKKKKRVPLTDGDLINFPVLWVRRNEPGLPHYLITAITSTSVTFSSMSFTYEGLVRDRYQYSTDRRTWYEFYKEVDDIS